MLYQLYHTREYIQLLMSANPCVSGPSLTLFSAKTEVMSPNPDLPSINPEDEADLSDSDSSAAATNAEFDPVLEAINFDALKSVVLDTRLKRDDQLSLGISEETNNLTCHIEEKPIFGSSNVLFVITFSDDVKWIVRFPGYGVSSFGELEARRLLSDIQTKALIRSSTSIPIPEVFAWDFSRDNPVGVPYHLEKFVKGRPLAERWTGEWLSDESKKMKILRKLAELMSQLHSIHFDKIGSLVLGADGASLKVDAMVDMHRSWEKMSQGEIWPTASLSGPFGSTKECLLSVLQDPEDVPEVRRHIKADIAILRQAIDSIPKALDTPQSFSLGHPDFNYQNILTDDEGEITGIIDWDGVETYPRALGFACYPSWITRDWDPAMYDYPKELPDPDNQAYQEDSPEQLISYRREYAAAMADQNLPEEAYSPDDTRLSHLVEAISNAVGSTMCRPSILWVLLEYAFNKKMPFTHKEFYDAWLDHGAEAWLDKIRDAFGRMWHEE